VVARALEVDLVRRCSIADKIGHGLRGPGRNLEIAIRICGIRCLDSHDAKVVRPGDDSVEIAGMLRVLEVTEGVCRSRPSKGNVSGQGIIRVANVNVWSIGNGQPRRGGHIEDRTSHAINDDLGSTCAIFQFTSVGVG
jgi:hypothetical protein